jgi:RNA polymerase sigma-54 factor
MRFGLGQELRPVQTQQQKLILAPRMIQSMEILQLPIMALQERIEQELQENAVLELEESDPDLPEETEERDNPDEPTKEEKELVVDDRSNNEDDFERLLEMRNPSGGTTRWPTWSIGRRLCKTICANNCGTLSWMS